MKVKVFLLVGAAIIISCTPQKEAESEYPLLETMGYYQRFSTKLWLAGINQNWEVANFYSHELEEVTEEFVSENVNHDGHNLSDFARTMIEPAIEEIEEAIEKKDEVLFVKNYRQLVTSCNTCHLASDHAFIRIKMPDSVNVFNQEF